MTEEERDDLVDLLPSGMVIWDDEQELAEGHFTDRDWAWWRDALEHPMAHRSCCKTCGCAVTCTLAYFYTALISSTVRELDRIGALVKPSTAGTTVEEAMADD